MTDEIPKNNDDWRQKLTPEQYHVMREKGTEAPFSGKYVHSKEKGVYRCAACGQELFSSDTKFDSGTGWPSFDDVVSNEHIETRDDREFGMHRVEVLCKKCGAHLGHVFPDGPTKTGQRYCINSVCLTLDTEKKDNTSADH
jgi:peptide-methionine (R)-S-oxide reductase